MHIYKDMRGAEHTIELSLATRRKLRDQLNVDLVAITKDDRLLRAFLADISDDEYLIKVVAICEGATTDELEAVFNGQTIDAAGAAFMEALTDFFQDSSPLKKPWRTLLDRLKLHQTEVSQLAETELMQIVAELDLSMVLNPQMTSTNGSPDSPPAADTSTTPGSDSPSDNCSGDITESPISNS